MLKPFSLTPPAVVMISAIVLFLGMASMTSAATIPSIYDAIFDGQKEFWGNSNKTTDVNLRIEAESGEVVHALETDFIGDGIGAVCHDIANFEGEQNRNVPASVKLPPNPGDYGFAVNIFTAENMQEADALKGTTACTGSNDAGAYSESDVVHVIPIGASNNDVGAPAPAPAPTGAFGFNSFAELVAALKAALGIGVGAPAPTTTPAISCPPTGVGTLALQGWLVDHYYMTQAQVDTGPGIYGPKTKAAQDSANAACRR